MTILTISLPDQLTNFIEEEAKKEYSSKSDVVRRAIALLKEETELALFWKSVEESRQGKTLKGDLDELVKLIKD